MLEQQPTTQTMKAAEVRANWSQVVDRVFRGQARVVVERSGIPVAAVVSAQDLERLNQMDAQRAARFRALDAMRDAFADVPPEELEHEVARALSEVRQRRRAAQAATEE